MSLGFTVPSAHRGKPELAREKPAPKSLVFRPIVALQAAGSAPGPWSTGATADPHNLTLLKLEPGVTCECCDSGRRKDAPVRLVWNDEPDPHPAV